MWFVLDVCFSQFVLVTGNVCVWRGVWNVTDAFLLPGSPVQSEVASLLLGYAGLGFLFLLVSGVLSSTLREGDTQVSLTSHVFRIGERDSSGSPCSSSCSRFLFLSCSSCYCSCLVPLVRLVVVLVLFVLLLFLSCSSCSSLVSSHSADSARDLTHYEDGIYSPLLLREPKLLSMLLSILMRDIAR